MNEENFKGLAQIIGKRIVEAVVIERKKKNPAVQVVLVFDDGTNLEFFGEFRPCKSIARGNADAIFPAATWKSEVQTLRVPEHRLTPLRRRAPRVDASGRRLSDTS
jgi:hypothetical protein